ncbi:MAG: Gfo/Idh/MocA family oxidoreductase [Kiritimatiellaeota bacterium]|nr:Gfo/Idh/MocA family oxidoreductase [Kiritimatiellota bacterium]
MEKAKVYADYRKLLETEKTVDAVIIASGQHWHLAMSKLCLQAGKHVYCEKPLAHSTAEARAIANMMPGCKLATQIGTQGGAKTFQGFDIAAQAAEFGMTGIVALRAGRNIEWDSPNLKAKGCPEADRWIHLPQRTKWLA